MLFLRLIPPYAGSLYRSVAYWDRLLPYSWRLHRLLPLCSSQAIHTRCSSQQITDLKHFRASQAAQALQVDKKHASFRASSLAPADILQIFHAGHPALPLPLQ